MKNLLFKTFACATLCAALSGCAANARQTPSANAANAEQTPVQTAEQTPAPAAPDQPAAPAAVSDDDLRHSQDRADLMIYESWPEETTLNNAHIADVVPVWLDAINGAKETIDFSEFYAIAKPGKALDPIIDALKNAAGRGVKIRFIVDARMNKDENAELPAMLASIKNIEVRTVDFAAVSGGVQHAKYFIVDGKTVYFGSQNFDWRSLNQISEMGARLRPEALVLPFKQIFELDWKLANGEPAPFNTQCGAAPVATVDYKGEPTRVETVASPKGMLPCEDLWDLPKIIDMIEHAKKSVSVQLLNYATTNYDKTKFTSLDDALIQAAKRGVKVRLLVSDWSTKPKTISDLKRLAGVDNIETRMIEIPEHSEGFVPFSRTIHSKFLVVDDDKTWLGTSNWAGDYFNKSRNLGIIATGKTLNRELTVSFDRYWNSAYGIPVDPSQNYPVKNQAGKD